MPSLNFKKQFAEKVKSGEKQQTIRAVRKRPIRYGDKLYLYTGMRTKYCKKLFETVCSDVKEIQILESGCITIDGWLFEDIQKHHLAISDGFHNWNEMYDWFKETHGFPFEGQLIYWGK